MMSTQKVVLSLYLGNKGKKKAINENAKSRKRANSVKENRCNTTFELAIDGEKEKVEQSQDSKKEEKECFDLAMEDQLEFEKFQYSFSRSFAALFRPSI